jgi:hypothetical protein
LDRRTNPVVRRPRDAPRLCRDSRRGFSAWRLYTLSLAAGERMTTTHSTAAEVAPAPRHQDLVDERLVTWFFLVGLTFMAISMLSGLLVSLQLIHANPVSGIATESLPSMQCMQSTFEKLNSIGGCPIPNASHACLRA